MVDFVIPCDTFARLTNVLADFPPGNEQGWFNSVRIDNGQAVASNRHVMAIENIGGPSGVVHIAPDPVLIAQCRTEAKFSSKLTITVNETLRFAVAKTTLGYIHPGNCALWLDVPNDDYNRWRSIVMQCKERVKKSRGGMFWRADDIARLASSSPSGRLVFEETIDAQTRPTLIRDTNDYEWLGVFNPFGDGGEHHNPATLPSWMTA